MNNPDTPIDRRQKRKLATRARIEEAAYTLFKRGGIEDTSIEMICREADVARRTFYSHFPNKHALLGGLGVSRLYSQAEPMLRQLMEKHRTTRERLEAMIDYIESRFAAFDTIDRELMISAPASFANNPEQQRRISRGAIDSFSRLIAAGQEAGDARRQFSADILASMIVGTLNTLTVSWAIDRDYPVFAKLEEARGMFEALICAD
ncbi:TetR/AcrR family transcriptional regulator [Parahaliea mediterranea]|uniref:TetR/AcrR family transcriptional regulator n=1 Tax=Parahaliea mediterranea TaxID=651086 RepID=A0A939DDU2_9GAMM|nr:TetR/AcrR family transcriptional regulator [Parahaliea mediterranea]MBN7796356.1 TetR/AcrR family transcriptional regulator [Parahaliea mediterranea]